jgi:LemA protein
MLEWLFIGLGVLLVIGILYFISKRNQFIRIENQIDNAWAQIDVQLQRRGELIPNLVETVKGYAAHEKGVFKAVSDARAAMIGAQVPDEKMAADNILTQALGRLFAIAEAYPDLKANTNFLQLQDELSHTENKVAFARQHYNDSVMQYNNAIEQFPGSLVAGGRTEKKMLQVPEATKALPKVSFA